MKAREGVLEFLNQVLKAELTAVHQYLLHAAMCKKLGYARLHEYYSHLANDPKRFAPTTILKTA